jgi:hypothetical protein
MGESTIGARTHLQLIPPSNSRTLVEPDLAQDGFLACVAPLSAARAAEAHAGDEDARGERLVDALAEEGAGAVALVGDGDGDEEDEDEGGEEAVEVDVGAHEGVERVAAIAIAIAIAAIAIAIAIATSQRPLRGRRGGGCGHDVGRRLWITLPRPLLRLRLVRLKTRKTCESYVVLFGDGGI